MLSLLVTIPILGAIILTVIENGQRVKKIALFTSLINLGLSAKIFIQFNQNCHEYQFVEEWGVGFFSFSFRY